MSFHGEDIDVAGAEGRFLQRHRYRPFFPRRFGKPEVRPDRRGKRMRCHRQHERFQDGTGCPPRRPRSQRACHRDYTQKGVSSPIRTARPSRWSSPSSPSMMRRRSRGSSSPHIRRYRERARKRSRNWSSRCLRYTARKPIEKKVYPHQIAFNCPSPYRRLPRQRLYKGRDEDGQRDEEDHGRRLHPGDGDDGQGPRLLRSFRIGQCRVRKGDDPGRWHESSSRKRPASKSSTIRRKISIPSPFDAAGKDDTFVGRIRDDDTVKYGLNMWVVADNIRKGAALNAVQIAESLIKKYL